MGKDSCMLKTMIKEEKEKPKPVHVKCSKEQLEVLQKKADQYTKGNLSEWLRYAGTNCIPPKSELTSDKKSKTKSKKTH